MIHEREACDARRGVVCLREAAVDHHQFSVGPYRFFSFAHLHRHMAVDDVAVFARNAELVENHVAHILPVAELVIVSLVLGVGILVGYEISLEGGHRRLVEQRRVRSTKDTIYSPWRILLVTGSVSLSNAERISIPMLCRSSFLCSGVPSRRSPSGCRPR